MLQGYLELKLSWQQFQKAPETLSDPERNRLLEVAARQNTLEQRILASAEAATVVVPAATLAQRIAEDRQRYPSEDDFAHDLDRSGINETTLGYQETFKQINTKSEDVNKYLQEHHQWGNLLELLESLTPEGVGLV